MAKKKKHEEHVNHERWLVSYADFITLLFAFFVVMFSVSQVDSAKLGKFSESFAESFGIHILSGNPGIFDGQNSPFKWVRPKGLDANKQQSTDAVRAIENTMRVLAKLEPPDATAPAAVKVKVAAVPPELLAGLRVLRRRQELVLRLDLDVLFASGSDELTAQATPLLELIGNELKGKPVVVRVEGHTDSRPINTPHFRSNWHLSTARATAVVVFFLERLGIEPARLSAAGHGEFQPVASNDTPEGRAKNRRVDVIVGIDNSSDEEPEDEATTEAKAGEKADDAPKDGDKDAEAAKDGEKPAEAAKDGEKPAAKDGEKPADPTKHDAEKH